MHRILSLVVAFSLICLSGCKHTVTIDSEPSGAEVRVNGQKIGTGPVQYEETTGWDKAYQIEVRKGNKKGKREVRQTEFNMPILLASAAGFFVVGIFSFAGLLFSKQLPERITVPLDDNSSGDSSGDSSDDNYDYGY